MSQNNTMYEKPGPDYRWLEEDIQSEFPPISFDFQKDYSSDELFHSHEQDMYQHLPCRMVQDWYLLPQMDLEAIENKFEDQIHSTRRSPLPTNPKAVRHLILFGKLTPQNPSQEPIKIQLDTMRFCCIDYSKTYRGYWIITPRAQYWLRNPCTKVKGVKLRLSCFESKQKINSNNQHMETDVNCYNTINDNDDDDDDDDDITLYRNKSLRSTFPSQKVLHELSEARLNLLCQITDIIMDTSSTDSTTFATRYHYAKYCFDMTIEQLYQTFKATQSLLSNNNNNNKIATEPFDIELARRSKTFLFRHLRFIHPDFTNSPLCNSLKPSKSPLGTTIQATSVEPKQNNVNKKRISENNMEMNDDADDDEEDDDIEDDLEDTDGSQFMIGQWLSNRTKTKQREHQPVLDHSFSVWDSLEAMIDNIAAGGKVNQVPTSETIDDICTELAQPQNETAKLSSSSSSTPTNNKDRDNHNVIDRRGSLVESLEGDMDMNDSSDDDNETYRTGNHYSAMALKEATEEKKGQEQQQQQIGQEEQLKQKPRSARNLRIRIKIGDAARRMMNEKFMKQRPRIESLDDDNNTIEEGIHNSNKRNGSAIGSHSGKKGHELKNNVTDKSNRNGSPIPNSKDNNEKSNPSNEKDDELSGSKRHSSVLESPSDVPERKKFRHQVYHIEDNSKRIAATKHDQQVEEERLKKEQQRRREEEQQQKEKAKALLENITIRTRKRTPATPTTPVTSKSLTAVAIQQIERNNKVRINIKPPYTHSLESPRSNTRSRDPRIKLRPPAPPESIEVVTTNNNTTSDNKEKVFHSFSPPRFMDEPSSTPLSSGSGSSNSYFWNNSENNNVVSDSSRKSDTNSCSSDTTMSSRQLSTSSSSSSTTTSSDRPFILKVNASWCDRQKMKRELKDQLHTNKDQCHKFNSSNYSVSSDDGSSNNHIRNTRSSNSSPGGWQDFNMPLSQQGGNGFKNNDYRDGYSRSPADETHSEQFRPRAQDNSLISNNNDDVNGDGYHRSNHRSQRGWRHYDNRYSHFSNQSNGQRSSKSPPHDDVRSQPPRGKGIFQGRYNLPSNQFDTQDSRGNPQDPSQVCFERQQNDRNSSSPLLLFAQQDNDYNNETNKACVRSISPNWDSSLKRNFGISFTPRNTEKLKTAGNCEYNDNDFRGRYASDSPSRSSFNNNNNATNAMNRSFSPFRANNRDNDCINQSQLMNEQKRMERPPPPRPSPEPCKGPNHHYFTLVQNQDKRKTTTKYNNNTGDNNNRFRGGASATANNNNNNNFPRDRNRRFMSYDNNYFSRHCELGWEASC